MQLIDLIFLILLFVAQPVNGALGYRYLLAQIYRGEIPDRVGFYRETLYLQWGALLVLGWVWHELDRPLDEVGFTWPTAIGWWIGSSVVVFGSGVLIYSLIRVRLMSSRQRQIQRDAAGSVIHLLPASRKELQYGYALSATAGIVEEIIYRGYVLWCLGHVMPLWAAAIVSSIGFGLGHAYQGIGGVIKTGLAGLFFAGFYLLTGSLLFPIIAHFLLDALQMRMVYELQSEDELQAPA